MMKCVFYNEYSTDKSPQVYQGACTTIDSPDPLAAIPLLKLIQPHVDGHVVSVDVNGNC